MVSFCTVGSDPVSTCHTEQFNGWFVLSVWPADRGASDFAYSHVEHRLENLYPPVTDQWFHSYVVESVLDYELGMQLRLHGLSSVGAQLVANSYWAQLK